MATKAMIEKWKRHPKHGTRAHNRCRVCGRPRGYLGKFALCRMCFRQLAHQGQIPGIRKSSW